MIVLFWNIFDGHILKYFEFKYKKNSGYSTITFMYKLEIIATKRALGAIYFI
jgi:hypothetical protein